MLTQTNNNNANNILSSKECFKIHARIWILCGKTLPTKKKKTARPLTGLLKMKSYTKKQRVFFVEKYFKNNKDLTAIVSFRTKSSSIDDDKIVKFGIQKIHE